MSTLNFERPRTRLEGKIGSQTQSIIYIYRLSRGWVFRILSGIKCTRHFIEFVVVETKRFVSSNVNVILTRQTCSQRSCMSAGSKRGALQNYFYERICHMLLISKYRGDWDPGLCTFWVLAKGEPLRNTKFQFFLRAKHIFFPEVATTQRFSFRISPMSAQT